MGTENIEGMGAHGRVPDSAKWVRGAQCLRLGAAWQIAAAAGRGGRRRYNSAFARAAFPVFFPVD